MITFVVGGARSGKSDYALQEVLATGSGEKKYFIATCPRIDSEINERIEKHVRERASLGFETIEEQTELTGVVKSIENGAVILIDCLTLWVNNVLYGAEIEKRTVTEADVIGHIESMVTVCREKNIKLIAVSNEVGMGLIPADSQNRLYRDLVGKCNRTIAAYADKVVFVSCGIPLTLKG